MSYSVHETSVLSARDRHCKFRHFYALAALLAAISWPEVKNNFLSFLSVKPVSPQS